MQAIFNDRVAFSLVGAAALAYAPHAIKVATLFSAQGLDYNNESPRETKVESVFPTNLALQDFCKRCSAAHMNGLEIFAFFAPTVAFAVARGVSDDVIASYASSFLLTRLGYNIAYLAGVNKPISYIRTGLFFSGVAIILNLIAASTKKQ